LVTFSRAVWRASCVRGMGEQLFERPWGRGGGGVIPQILSAIVLDKAKLLTLSAAMIIVVPWLGPWWAGTSTQTTTGSTFRVGGRGSASKQTSTAAREEDLAFLLAKPRTPSLWVDGRGTTTTSRAYRMPQKQFSILKSVNSPITHCKTDHSLESTENEKRKTDLHPFPLPPLLALLTTRPLGGTGSLGLARGILVRHGTVCSLHGRALLAEQGTVACLQPGPREGSNCVQRLITSGESAASAMALRRRSSSGVRVTVVDTTLPSLTSRRRVMPPSCFTTYITYMTGEPPGPPSPPRTSRTSTTEPFSVRPCRLSMGSVEMGAERLGPSSPAAGEAPSSSSSFALGGGCHSNHPSPSPQRATPTKGARGKGLCELTGGGALPKPRRDFLPAGGSSTLVAAAAGGGAATSTSASDLLCRIWRTNTLPSNV
jgi:hypothetical protein